MELFPEDAVVRRLIAKVEARNISSTSLPLDVRSRLYYEAHVTIQPELDVDARAAFDDNLRDLVQHKPEWRAANFIMIKDHGRIPDAFVTYRGTSLRETAEAVQDMVRTLERRGFTVLRWKIEDTLFDSKRGDVL